MTRHLTLFITKRLLFLDINQELRRQEEEIKTLPKENRDACEAGNYSNGGRPLPLSR